MQERTLLEDQLTSIDRIERELDDQITLIELGETCARLVDVKDASSAARPTA